MKHIKDALIASLTGKIRAFEAHLRDAVKLGDEPEAERLRKLIDEWRNILEDLLTD